MSTQVLRSNSERERILGLQCRFFIQESKWGLSKLVCTSILVGPDILVEYEGIQLTEYYSTV